MLIYKVSEKETTNGEKVLAIFNIDLHANYSIVQELQTPLYLNIIDNLSLNMYANL